MLNAFFLNDSSKLPIEWRDVLFHRNRSSERVSLMEVNHHSNPLFSDPGTSFSALEPHLPPSLIRYSSNPEDKSWSDVDFRSWISASDVISRSVTKGEKSERYKTELCRSFEETGVCKYKEKCQFAHGVQELRNVKRHPKYKTDLCRTYHSTGFCPYGSRCHFVHAELPCTTSPTKHSPPPPPPPPPPSLPPPLPLHRLEASEIQCQQQFSDKRLDANCLSASLDQSVGISRNQLEQFLDAFHRVLKLVSYGHACPPQSSSPNPLNFEIISRQDSVSSGSRRSSPDRLSIPPVSMASDDRNPFSRFSSCSGDSEVFSLGSQSPTPSSTSFFGSSTPDPSSALSSFWTRAPLHPFSIASGSSV